MKVLNHNRFTYRHEIDGLRAVAVIPVILFHAGVKTFAGGFVGVDIFFVISGYLISTIIFNELAVGKFSIADFYERRARRILPPLIVVLASSIAAAWFWLDALDFRDFSKSLVAVSTFSSNILFWRETGYFDTTAELKPLLHTWTLAVEEQYYVILPLIMLAGYRLGRNRLKILFIMLASGSLIFAQVGAESDSTAAFYLLPTRAWELLIGSIIAVHLAHCSAVTNVTVRGHWLNEIFSVVGLLMIFFALIFFDESTVYPGVHALLPTLGAALTITHANGHTLVGRALSAKVLTFLGLISYSAYLWHQPIFAFVRNVSIIEPSQVTMLAFTLFSLCLAYLSWRYVEQPFRNKHIIKPKLFYRISVLAMLVVTVVGLSGFYADGFEYRFGKASLMADSFTEPTIRHDCDRDYDGKGWDIGFCTFGDTEHATDPEIAVFGDSHAEALLPAFDRAAKKNGQAVVEIGLGGCPPLIGVDVMDSPYDPGVCAALAAREFQYVKTHHIQKVFLVSRWTLYTDSDLNKERKTDAFLISSEHRERTQENSRAAFEQGLIKTIQAYREIGAELFIVAQVPQQLVTPKNIYYRLSRDTNITPEQKLSLIEKVSVPSAKNAEIQRFSRSLFSREEIGKYITMVNLDDSFCNSEICLLGDTRSYYKDYNHLNEYGAERVSDRVGELLMRN